MRRVMIFRIQDDSDPGANSARVIIGVLRQPKNPAEGAQYSEIMEMLPIIHKFEKAEKAMPEVGNSSVLLEEAEYQIVRERLTTTGFTLINDAIGRLLSAVVEAESIEVQELKEHA